MVSITLKVTLPERPFAKKKWLDEMARVQRQTSVPRLKKLFQKTVFGWSKKPAFTWAQHRSSGQMSIEMEPSGPNAETWKLVNAGSPAHYIPAKPGGILSFRPGYRSATRPGQLMGRRAYRSGKRVGATIISKNKPHPGFEARDFITQIIHEYENPFMNDMQDAINTVARS